MTRFGIMRVYIRQLFVQVLFSLGGSVKQMCGLLSEEVDTVEPQSYRLHSYGKLGQPDTEIEYIFGKYHQNFYKMGLGHQV